MVRASRSKRTIMSAANDTHMPAIRLWLYAVAALVFVLVLVGGATRLTESGLSITEWRPVMGTLPPLGEAAWQAEFKKYQAIPQYRELNRGMSLDQFKTIYWWEWAHRLVGQLVGVAFLLPFLWFLGRGWVAPRLQPRLWFIFRTRGAAGRRRLVDGGLRPRRSRRGFAISVGDASRPRLCDICALIWTARRLEDRPALILPVACAQPPPFPDPRAAADLSRRIGRRPARRLHLQHLAADRWRLHARCRAAFP